MLIYLIGFMGSGKTTVGKQLALKLNYKFVDLDSFIEVKLNSTIPEIFDTQGEVYFREMERMYLHQTFKFQDAIISCGGGAPCFFDNLEMMNKNGLTIYIKMTAAALKNRLENSNRNRPLVQNKKGKVLLDFIEEKLAERNPYYEKAKIISLGFDMDINVLANLVRFNLK